MLTVLMAGERSVSLLRLRRLRPPRRFHVLRNPRQFYACLRYRSDLRHSSGKKGGGEERKKTSGTGSLEKNVRLNRSRRKFCESTGVCVCACARALTVDLVVGRQ